MLQLTVLGHIGADAKSVTENGKTFVSFNVAHSEKWTSQDGQVHESTTWVSCLLNGDGGNVLPYLKKGQLIFAQGRCSTRVYSSRTERKMMAGLNLTIDRIELVGTQPDPIPRQLITSDGCLIRTHKFWQADTEDMKAAGLSHTGQHQVSDQSGNGFLILKNGWVQRVDNVTQQQQQSDTVSDGQHD